MESDDSTRPTTAVVIRVASESAIDDRIDRWRELRADVT